MIHKIIIAELLFVRTKYHSTPSLRRALTRAVNALADGCSDLRVSIIEVVRGCGIFGMGGRGGFGGPHPQGIVLIGLDSAEVGHSIFGIAGQAAAIPGQRIAVSIIGDLPLITLKQCSHHKEDCKTDA